VALPFKLYEERPTFIYRIDPRVKVIGVLVIFAISVLFTDPLYLGPFFFAILAIDLAGGVPLIKVLVLLKSLALLVVISMLMWPLLYHPGTELFRLVGIPITDIGIAYGFGMAFRILNMVIAPISLTLTTSQRDFILGLRGIGLPHKAAYALSTAFRFVPTVVGVGRGIIEAQKARGLDIDAGGLTDRLRNYAALMAPLLINSIRIAQQLALAVESKALSSTARRTTLRVLRLSALDVAILFGYGLALATVITLRLVGYGALPV
jgi:energy-coupling factor transport system permease protein